MWYVCSMYVCVLGVVYVCVCVSLCVYICMQFGVATDERCVGTC